MNRYELNGRVWVIADGENQLIPDIDTDQIYHNAHLHITDIQEMGKYTFGNLHGWEKFSSQARQGDMVIAGSNFGSGSSRQQAVDCFKSLGIQMIVAASFGAIYKRNAINSGFVIMTLGGLQDIVRQEKIRNLDELQVNLTTNRLKNIRTGEQFELLPFTQVQKDIFDQGNLLNI
jgi:3-isopropylmalate dehydratase small subunit